MAVTEQDYIPVTVTLDVTDWVTVIVALNHAEGITTEEVRQRALQEINDAIERP